MLSGVADFLATNNYEKKIATGIAFAMAIFGAVGCLGVDPVVKVGLVGPFVGKNRDIGYDVIYSTRLAVREINNSGGIGGYRVSLVALDDFGDPEMAQENAKALVADQGVVAVIGHWLPETTEPVAEIYEDNQLPFVRAGTEPFEAVDPLTLPSDFRESYQEITPFDEEAGPFSGAGYDATQLVFSAMSIAFDESGTIDRSSVLAAMEGLIGQGMTGPIYAP